MYYLHNLETDTWFQSRQELVLSRLIEYMTLLGLKQFVVMPAELPHPNQPKKDNQPKQEGGGE